MTEQQILIRPHAFSQDPGVVTVRAGQTLKAMLSEAVAGAPLAEDVVVRIGGYEVPRKLWDKVRPKAGSHILAYREGNLQGGSARQIIGAVIMIAVAYFTMGTGTTWGASLAAAWGGSAAAWNIGIMMLTTLAVSALTRPPTPGGGGGSAEQWHQLTGTSNQINPWGVIPLVLGEARFFPPHAALPFTEAVGEDSYQTCMFDLGEGDLEWEDPTIGGTPLSSFEGVQYEVTRTPTLYTSDVSQTDVSASINFADTNSPVIRTTTSGVTVIAVDLLQLRGLYGVGTGGDDFAMYVLWRIDYRPVGTTTWLAPSNPRLSYLQTSWVGGGKDLPDLSPAPGRYLVKTLNKDPFAAGIRWEVPAGTYDVRVTRLDTLRGGSKNQYVDDAMWTTMRAYKPVLPSTTGTTKFVLRIRSNGQVNGTLQNFAITVRQRIPVYDPATGTWSAPQVNLNPAWVSWWLMASCPGVRKHVPVNRMHLEEFADYAEFCTANSFEVRGVLDVAMPLGELVEDVMACSLGSLGMRDGRYRPVFDRGEFEQVMAFTPRESSGFRFDRPFVRMPHALRVQFVNPAADWQQDEVIVLDDGYSWRGVDARGNPSTDPEPELFETLQLRFAADAIHAWRVGRHHLAQGKFRLASYSWESDIAGLSVVRGDCVTVANDVMEWGEGTGKVVALAAAGGGATLELDEPMATEAGQAYRVMIRRQADGSVVSANLAASGGESHIFALTTLPAGVQPGDVATLVKLSRDLRPLLVTGVTYGRDFSTSFTAVHYDERVAPYWANPPESIVSEISGALYGDLPPPDVTSVSSGFLGGDRDDAGITSPVIRIGVAPPNGILRDIARPDARPLQ